MILVFSLSGLLSRGNSKSLSRKFIIVSARTRSQVHLSELYEFSDLTCRSTSLCRMFAPPVVMSVRLCTRDRSAVFVLFCFVLFLFYFVLFGLVLFLECRKNLAARIPERNRFVHRSRQKTGHLTC